MTIFILVSLFSAIAGLIAIWKDWTREGRIIIPLILTICLIGPLVFNNFEHYDTLKKEAYTKTWGSFSFPTDVNRKPALFFGRYQLNSVTIGKDKWETWLESGKVNIQGTIRDREGNIVFQINGSDWKNWTGKDFNYDERGIEVKDSKGNIIFQLEFDKNENKISIFGIFYYSPTQLVLAGREDNWVVNENMPSANTQIDSFISSTKPMFRYPREIHLGQRAETVKKK